MSPEALEKILTISIGFAPYVLAGIIAFSQFLITRKQSNLEGDYNRKRDDCERLTRENEKLETANAHLQWRVTQLTNHILSHRLTVPSEYEEKI